MVTYEECSASSRAGCAGEKWAVTRAPSMFLLTKGSDPIHQIWEKKLQIDPPGGSFDSLGGVVRKAEGSQAAKWEGFTVFRSHTILIQKHHRRILQLSLPPYHHHHHHHPLCSTVSSIATCSEGPLQIS
jgi:hypothetical protein